MTFIDGWESCSSFDVILVFFVTFLVSFLLCSWRNVGELALLGMFNTQPSLSHLGKMAYTMAPWNP